MELRCMTSAGYMWETVEMIPPKERKHNEGEEMQEEALLTIYAPGHTPRVSSQADSSLYPAFFPFD